MKATINGSDTLDKAFSASPLASVHLLDHPAMATAASMDLATTFLGCLAKRQAKAFKIQSPALSFPWKLPSCRFSTAALLSSISLKSVRLSSSHCVFSKSSFSSEQKGQFRRFRASAAATESDSSDLLTKIPPDDRIPATIITGFLGSGKVFASLASVCGLYKEMSCSIRCSMYGGF
ncbi:hypothetical protein ACLOJK_027604 [Asimina triloba]